MITIKSRRSLRKRATSLLKRDSRFVLDNNLIIASVKSGWTRSTDLLFTIILSDAELYGNLELLNEYEKYIHKFLGVYPLFVLLRNRIALVDPGIDSLMSCKPYFPESQYADVVHAATCLETGAVMITNDVHFNRINDSGLIKVWNISLAIKELLG